MTKLADRLRPLLGNPNVQAFLHVIREGESSQDDRAYFMRWPGKTFYDLTKHPRIFEPGPNGPSSAAGAYQITYTTYADFAPKLGVEDFGRSTQDLIALAIIDAEGALPYVYGGDVKAAIEALGGRWASFPSSTVGQPTVKMQRLLEVFNRYGGKLSQPVEIGEAVGTPQQPAAPTITERVMAAPAIILAAAQALLPVVIDLFRARGSKTSERNAKVLETVNDAAPILTEIAKSVAGGNEQQAAEAILASKELQQQFRAQVALRWTDVEPFLTFEEESRNKAREFISTVTAGDGWRSVGAGLLMGILSLVVVAGGGYMFYQFMHSATVSSEQKAMILGALIAAFASVISFWFGSSASSRVKDQTIAEQAKR